jgi:chromosome segregation ATPase
MGLFRRAKPMDPAEIERMKAEMASLREALERHGSSATALESRVGELDARAVPADPSDRLDELAAKVAELEARVTSVSTELANQIAELGNDIDALNSRPPGDGVDPEAVGELRDGQVRLANEQARYQIAFREDLARLAEQLRRPG